MSLPPDATRTYLPVDPIEDPRRLRKHLLVREVRRVIEHAALLDLQEVDEATLDDMTARVRAVGDALDPLPSLRRHGGAGMAGDDDAALRERSPFSGRSNPLASPLRLWMEGDGITRGRATWGAPYEGPPGCLHGGFVAAAFDDLMGLAQMTSGKAGFTGTLTVKLIKPTPLYEPIDYAAGLDRVEGRKIWVWGTAMHEDTLLAEASIVFIAMKPGQLKR